MSWIDYSIGAKALNKAKAVETSLAGRVQTDVPAGALFTDTVYDDSTTLVDSDIGTAVLAPDGDGSELVNLPASGANLHSTTPTERENLGVGYLWLDTNTNELYICEDGTGNSNKWVKFKYDVYDPRLIIKIDSSQTPTTADEMAVYFTAFDSGTTINWGDGTAEVAVTEVKNYSHAYSTSGEYDVVIKGGGAIHLGVDKDDTSATSISSNHILEVMQWGDFNFSACDNMFRSVTTDFLIPLASPKLSNVTKMSYMFYDASSFNQDISNWDVSSVTDMSYMFYDAIAFNQDISNWDVSNVTKMYSTFFYASSFNQDISNWDVSSVTDMSYMFYGASVFNQDISSWDVSNVAKMYSMFYNASSFNQDISNWDVGNVTKMTRMFFHASSFNQDISSWDVSNVTDMSYMFYGASVFNNGGVALSWSSSTASVTTFDSMFKNAVDFNQDISSWDTSSATDMDYMFKGASDFTSHDLSGWDVASVTTHTDFLTDAGTGNTEPTWA